MSSSDMESCPGVAAIVLAAGSSRRMGAQDKLLARVGNRSMIRRVVAAVLASRACRTCVVTGAGAEAVATELTDLPVSLVHNPESAQGLARSLRVGVEFTGDECEGILVLLGDMPFVTPALIDSLIEAFDPDASRDIVVPEMGGRIGNPVLFSTRYRAALLELTGDRGARSLIESNPDRVLRLAVGDEAIFFDVDTPEALELANKSLGPAA